MLDKIKQEIKKVIVGQEELIDSMLIALLSEGHILLEGVPGVAKTTAVNSLAQTLGLKFKRVQFTPDLLPSDITGNEILDLKNNEFTIKHGPIFTNLLLADEINRAGAKVQSALLEAMAEKQVTIGEDSFKLESPFMVLATSNPIDQDGTYELPEASLDRFMLKVKVDYNSFDEEFEIAKRATNKGFETINQVLNLEDLENLKQKCKDVFLDDEISKYILKIIFATREPKNYGLEEFNEIISYGVSPRATIDLHKACKARAFLNNKDYVTPYDVIEVVHQVLEHRMILNYKADSKGITTKDIINKIIEVIKAP
ncbi:AAA family ATPase [Arcobacter cloacae]|uniref:ATPase n=1 Tax=Arcobacter cloacae TaxID=1054034 RepID=A0A6M8NFX0_9BACT|nr:MoxR family ATPase [Arcobacter cloacae]QKF90205.1 MoxR-like ATPase [Arcobacter cloacae]RXI42002.1 ATPase [Arcobacter cloacae]